MYLIHDVYELFVWDSAMTYSMIVVKPTELCWIQPQEQYLVKPTELCWIQPQEQYFIKRVVFIKQHFLGWLVHVPFIGPSYL